MCIGYLILSYLGCPFSSNQCSQDPYGYDHLDYFPKFISDLDTWLIITTILMIFIMGRYNYDMVKVISSVNAMVFVVLSICANGLIWIFGLLFTLIARGDPNYIIESLDMKVIAIKFAGYVCSALGLLLYNEVICSGD